MCRHPFADQFILDGRYVECLICGKKLADSWAPLNEVFDKNDYPKQQRERLPSRRTDANF